MFRRSIPPVIVAIASCCGPRVDEPIPEDAPTRYAESVCAAYERCGCMGEGYDDMSDLGVCQRENEATFRRVAGWPDMKFNADCFESFLEAMEQDNCASGADWPGVRCAVFTGGVSRGAACVADWSANWRDGHPGLLAEGQCKDGACYNGTCGGNQATVVGLGSQCHLEHGVHCNQATYCSPDGVCLEKVGPGETCDTPRACRPQHSEMSSIYYYCSGATPERGGICQPKIPVGEPCSPEDVEPCEYPGYCTSEGICAASWPSVCFYAHTPPRDFYIARHWIPER